MGRLESFHPADFDSGGEELVKVQEASSRGLALGKAQLIRPSQNNSLRMHCRLDGEHRLQSVWINTFRKKIKSKAKNLSFLSSFLQDFMNGVTVSERVLCPGQSVGGTASWNIKEVRPLHQSLLTFKLVTCSQMSISWSFDSE